MQEQGERPRRPRANRTTRPKRNEGPAPATSAPETPRSFSGHLRRDRAVFALTLGFLGFTTTMLAMAWRLFNDPLLLALTIASVLPAFWLFYLRDRPAS